MEVKKAKSVRFDSLVQQLGRPAQLILWTPPEQNRAFIKAVDENRVITILQPNVGTKKDFGAVGFLKKANVAFLVFPKRIPYAPSTKVVGIKYDRIAESKPEGAVYKAKPNGRPRVPLRKKPAGKSRVELSHREKKRTPDVKHFRATAVLNARQTVQLKVDAHSAAEARKLFSEKMAKEKIDLNQSSISRSLKNVTTS
jgi:hypothetical protein